MYVPLFSDVEKVSGKLSRAFLAIIGLAQGFILGGKP